MGAGSTAFGGAAWGAALARAAFIKNIAANQKNLTYANSNRKFFSDSKQRTRKTHRIGLADFPFSDYLQNALQSHFTLCIIDIDKGNHSAEKREIAVFGRFQ